jgi:hypothetical protein
MRPYIKRDFGRIVTETEFNQKWVDAIKYVVPHASRTYGGGSTWSFSPEYYTCVRTITEHFFGSKIIDSTGGVAEPQTNMWKERWSAWVNSSDSAKPKSAPFEQFLDDILENGKVKDAGDRFRQKMNAERSTRLSSGAFATLYVTSDAPSEVIKAAYRALAAMHHPDKGGDAASMVRINAAYAELKTKGRVS